MATKLTVLLSQLRHQSSPTGYHLTSAQFKVLEQYDKSTLLLVTHFKAARDSYSSLQHQFAKDWAESMLLIKASSEETVAQVSALCTTTQEMLKFVDREIRRTLKPVIPTSIILSNLQYPVMSDLADLDSPKGGQVSAAPDSEARRPDVTRADHKPDPAPPAKPSESSGKTDHIQLLIATLEALGKDLMKIRNLLHAFYYKAGGKPSLQQRSHTHDTVPSIWGDAEIIDGGVSPLGASLAPDFSFTKAAFTEDLKNVLNVGDQELFSTKQREKLIAGIMDLEKRKRETPLPSSARREIKKVVDKGHFKLDLDQTMLRKCVVTEDLPISIREKLVYEYINSSRQSSRKSVTIEELLRVRLTNRQETDSSALPSLDGLLSATPRAKKEFEVSAASYTNSLFAKPQQVPLCLSPEELPQEAEILNSSLASTIDEKMEEKRKSEAKQRLPGLWGQQGDMLGSVYLPPIGSSKQPEKRLKRSVSNIPPKIHGRKPKALARAQSKEIKESREPMRRKVKRVNSVENEVSRGRVKHKAIRSSGEDVSV